ncbi:hypothetical protein RSWS8N_11840 [Cereibacter sphaeroides WS8N]|uniref:hypothetical protein n=1 Tax=Cereibacter sphaeroides TaxID=1063 RepID=UPI00020DF23C|nr:hypothetical protein [Cereibacter sphaeroides]EGJ22776.1 hypothetical protein RSWS8N_11840 [Cereibacter sphaeroides WS8N]
MRSCYFIVLKHVVVAQDLAQTILVHDPEAEVIVGRRPEDLSPTCHPRVAFVGLSPEKALAHPAIRELLHEGTRLVLLGEEAEEAGEGADWWILSRPFTSDAVLALLERAAEERRDQKAD